MKGDAAQRLIEDYALLSDCRSAALVSRDGSLDWLCWPRFDSAACFARLLGDERHGHWSIAPQTAQVRVARRYLPDTLILETEFDAAEGSVRLTDLMPIGTQAPTFLRLVEGLRGRVAMRMCCAPRFDYGALAPWLERFDEGVRVLAGADVLELRSSMPLQVRQRDCCASFVVEVGQRVSFTLSYADAPSRAPADPEAALTETARYWRGWIGKLQRPCAYPQALRRSLLTLRALIHAPSGGLLAAPTTSLPEQFGGSLNWDYRFAWLRDSTFTLTALLNAGYRDEAQAWRDWILRALAGEPEKARPIYRIDGARDVNEYTLTWLPGFGGAGPVRVGNAAAYQRQIDIYGEVLDAMELATRAGIAQSEHGRHVERAIVEYLEGAWDEPSRGIWEARGESHRYIYSQVMAWVGVDRFLRSATRHGHGDAALIQRLGALRARIHQQVCEHGYDVRHGHFVQHYGERTLDASLLLLPLVGFLPIEDPRIAGTVAAVERELLHDGLVLRNETIRQNRQGAFLACTCWLADCRRLQGRLAEGREAIERVLGVSNDLGLLAEEYDLQARRLCGNFPQAFSHLALVNALLGLEAPMLQRGGG